MAQHLIETLAGVIPGSTLESALANRAETRHNAQLSYNLLLHPAVPGPVSQQERLAIAAFVASLQGELATDTHYRTLLEQSGPDGATLSAVIASAAASTAAFGPYGSYPAGPLSGEDQNGPTYRADDALRDAIGDKLAAALEHAHLLLLHPRDASQDALQRLLDAGWTTAGIVTISQLVAFLSFQIRIVAGLRAVLAAKQIQPAQAHAEIGAYK